jgi:hypothetical protein
MQPASDEGESREGWRLDERRDYVSTSNAHSSSLPRRAFDRRRPLVPIKLERAAALAVFQWCCKDSICAPAVIRALTDPIMSRDFSAAVTISSIVQLSIVIHCVYQHIEATC